MLSSQMCGSLHSAQRCCSHAPGTNSPGRLNRHNQQWLRNPETWLYNWDKSLKNADALKVEPVDRQIHVMPVIPHHTSGDTGTARENSYPTAQAKGPRTTCEERWDEMVSRGLQTAEESKRQHNPYLLTVPKAEENERGFEAPAWGPGGGGRVEETCTLSTTNGGGAG